MKWYEFDQNNSGGRFNNDFGYSVFIQAVNAFEANLIAEEIGIYFDGCEQGLDCECCGDRWHRTYESDAKDYPRDNPYAERWDLKVKVKPYYKELRDITESDLEPSAEKD